ncbi:hypothetical protein quinque_006661 [Culex quinquefasciatus]
MIPEPPMILLRLLVEAAGPPDPSLFGIEEYRTDRFFEAELARLVIAFSTAVVHILEKRLFIIQLKQQQQQRLDPVLPRRGPISGHFECTHTLFLPDTQQREIPREILVSFQQQLQHRTLATNWF